MTHPTIALIEDDALLLEMYEATLSGEGYEIKKASDGKKALALITSEQPDLILLDLSMPSISGFEILEELRKQKSTIPVIVISNTDEEAAIRKCEELGVKEYVVKAQTNLDQIKQIVARHVPRPAAK
ncbi:response regulator [Patescibacteria group bacterium]|nr:response regulator [Patescibacteria group bacterium]